MLSIEDPIPLAIPCFLAAIFIEILWTRRNHKHEYHVNDTLTCLTTSIFSSLAGLYGAGFIGYCYWYLYNHYHPTEMHEFRLSLQIFCWLSLFLLQDFTYYWFHRISHRVNFLWAAHLAHHSSEEYNFAVALRQSTFQQFFAWPFYLPLALAGFPPEWLATVISFNLIYQFWFHTREINRLPTWIEAIFNTPSHHRVHHGTNPQYLDKNYGGIFIIWDKLFGTFEAEGEEVRYGITVPLKSFNPVWVNVHYFFYLWRMSWAAPGLRQAILIWVMPPDWKVDWVEGCTEIRTEGS